MPKEYQMSERREWLRRLENGESESRISEYDLEGNKRQGITPDKNTIKRGIEKALKERNATHALESLITDRVQQHHDQLISVVNNTLSAVVMPDTSLLLFDHAQGKGDIFLPASRITFDRSKGEDVLILQDEGSLIWKPFREHLKNERFLKTLSVWKSAVVSHFRARIALVKAVDDKLEKQLKCKFGQDRGADKPPFILRHTANRLIQHFVGIAVGQLRSQKIEGLITSQEQNGVVYFANQVLVRCPGLTKETENQVVNAVDIISKSPEMKMVGVTYNKIERPMIKLREKLEVISMAGMVPGKCKVCHQLGL